MAYDENPDGIDDILLTLEDSEKIRLPTLTLYTGERLIPSADPNKPPPPPVNLHLSLGGSYSSSTTTAATATAQHENYSINSTPDVPAAVNNILNASVMMKRSYLEQNNHEMPGGHEEEIILIDDNMNAAGGGGGGGYYNKQKYSNDEKDMHTAPPDIDWAARSASGNRALLRALHIIKSESSSITTHQKRTTSTRTHDDQPPRYQGVAWQHPADVVFRELEPAAGIANSMNPDDFLSISPTPNNCAVNVDVNAFKETSSSSNSSSRNPENIIFHTATHDKGKSSVPAAPPIPNYYYYGTRGNGNLITSNFSGIRNNSIRTNIIAPINSYNNVLQGALGSRKSAGPPPPPTARLSSNSDPPALMPMAPCCSLKENALIMHYHDTYMTAAAVNGDNTQTPPAAAFAFGSNQWSNVPVSGGFSAGHPLMKRNEYLRDSQIDMIRHMPTVTTDGGIPDGRRIEGFLYRYSKYEDVIIVCFCHGSFFSPKEFVMHAAGGGGGTAATEFQNPMKLITIVPHD